MKEFLAKYMPVDASEHGPALDSLNAVVHWVMLILFIFWGAYFLYVLWRFRAGRNPRASYAGMRSHWSTYSEAGVAIVEAVLLVAFSIPLWTKWATPPDRTTNPLEIRITGEQFAWNIHYPGKDGVFGRRKLDLVSSTNSLGLDLTDPAAKDDVVSLNELHVVLGRPVLIHISSKDVIHSFFLPTMRVKQDAIPGMDIPIHFTPVMASKGAPWEIACAQLCGLGHYRMRGFLFVDTKAQFEQWLADSAPDAGAPANPVPDATPAQPPPATPPVS